MKAYYLSVKDDDDAGGLTVFANTVKEARKQIYGTDLYDATDGEWIRVQAHRDKKYDGLENLPKVELDKIKWRDGWRWFDMDYPDPDEDTDEDFYKWYESEFGDRK